MYTSIVADFSLNHPYHTMQLPWRYEIDLKNRRPGSKRFNFVCDSVTIVIEMCFSSTTNLSAARYYRRPHTCWPIGVFRVMELYTYYINCIQVELSENPSRLIVDSHHSRFCFSEFVICLMCISPFKRPDVPLFRACGDPYGFRLSFTRSWKNSDSLGNKTMRGSSLPWVIFLSLVLEVLCTSLPVQKSLLSLNLLEFEHGKQTRPRSFDGLISSFRITCRHLQPWTPTSTQSSS